MTFDARIPVWLDCDPGHDDAFAILLAAYHPRLHLLGISTVYGNAPLSRTTENALSVLQAIGKPDVNVFPGADKPFCREIRHAPEIHGESGLDGTSLLPKPVRSALHHCNATTEMREALLTCPPNTAWLVTTGTMTNAGALFATFPEVIDHVRGLSVMGGAVGDSFSSAMLGHDFKDASGKLQARIGNYTPYAEFNIWCDPESAQSIFSNSVLAAKTTLIPLDLTHQAFVTKDVRGLFLKAQDGTGIPTRLRQMFHELLMFFASTYADVFGIAEGPPLHDPLAVAVLLTDIHDGESGSLFDDGKGERWHVEIVLEGEEVGRTKIRPAQGKDGVVIPRSLNLKDFWEMLNDCLARADESTAFAR